VRLDQHDALPTDITFAYDRFAAPRLDAYMMPPGKNVQGSKTYVMPRTLIFASRISEADY
jgi:hypothetical protein